LQEHEIGIVQGDRCDYGPDIKVSIAMVHSLAGGNYPSNFYDWAGLVIVDESVHGDVLITTDKGQLPIQQIVEQKLPYKVLTLNEATLAWEWKSIVKYHAHAPKSAMYEITHELGSFRVTGEHPCFTQRGWVKASELLQEDFLTLDLKHSIHYTDSYITKKMKSPFLENASKDTFTIARKHNTLSVLRCEVVKTPSIVYDLEIADNHNFVANGVVVHNCHRIAATWFVNSMFKLNSYWRVGLSATPKRSDGKDFVFKSHLGDIGAVASNHLIPPKVLVVNSGWKLPSWKKRDSLTGTYSTVPMPHKAGRMAGVVKAMGMDDERNHLIADLCYKAYVKGRKTVIFFEQIDNHLKKLRPILIKMGIPTTDIKEYIGGLTEEQRVTNAKARVILGSYSYFSEGTDIPDLDTAILASPRSNIMQAVGRILRLVDGKKEPVIFDIVDECSPILVGMHHNRMRQYNELKAKVIRFS
jgi:hypothetical protein